MVRVVEGNSITISCTSIGAPIPSITWEFNGQSMSFNTTDTVTDPQIELARRNPDDPNDGLVPVTISNIVSDLRIVNAQYPEDDGVYTCIGSNDVQMINSISDNIIVQVVGEYKVYTCILHVCSYFTLIYAFSFSRGRSDCFSLTSQLRWFHFSLL